MKINLILPEALGAFGRYAPELLPPADGRVDRNYLAFSEEDLALGLAIVDIGRFSAEIVSIAYDESVAPGVCERALVQQLQKNAAEATVEDLYLYREGTEEELSQLDGQLLRAGFFALPVDVRQLEATLGQVLETPAFQSLQQLKSTRGSLPLGETPGLVLRQFHAAHPGLPLDTDRFDPVISRCWVSGEDLQALLLTRRDGSTVTVEWLYSDGTQPMAVAEVARDAILACESACLPETRLLLACEPGPIDALAEKLGFAPRTDLSARLYQHYLK